VTSPVVVRPGAGTTASFELRASCRGGATTQAGSGSARASAVVQPVGGRERTIPLDLGAQEQLLSPEFFCSVGGPNGPQGSDRVTVDGMQARTDGSVLITLRSTSLTDLRVTALASPTGNAGPFDWRVTPVPADGVLIKPSTTQQLVVRLRAPTCSPDQSIPSAGGLVALRVQVLDNLTEPEVVDGVAFPTWDDTAVSTASAAAAVLQCRR
jgi:hypothetical protein